MSDKLLPECGRRFDSIEGKIDKLDDKFDKVVISVNGNVKTGTTVGKLIKFVITPLIIILGGLAGVNLVN